MTNDYSPDEMQMMYHDITQRAQARYRREAILFLHTVMWIAASIFLIFLVEAGVLAVFWTVVYIMHYGVARIADGRDKAIDQTLERYGLRPQTLLENEKTKRDARLVTLSDDGELVDYDEYNDDNIERRSVDY